MRTADDGLHGGIASLPLLSLRLARVFGLPLDGGAAALLELDFEQLGLEGEVAPERAGEVDENRTVEEEHAREVVCAHLVGVDGDDDERRESDHARDALVANRFPLVVRLGLHLRLAVGLGVSRQALGEQLAKAGELGALGAELEDAYAAHDVRQHEHDDEAVGVLEGNRGVDAHEVGGGSDQDSHEQQAHEREGDGAHALRLGYAPGLAQAGNGLDVALDLLVGGCVHVVPRRFVGRRKPVFLRCLKVSHTSPMRTGETAMALAVRSDSSRELASVHVMAFRYAICAGGRGRWRGEFVVTPSCGIMAQFMSQT